MSFIIREALESDAKRVCEIYGQYVPEVTATFNEVNPSVEEYRKKILHVKESYPFFVAEDETGEVVGFVYGSQLRPHDAYRWNVESTIYLDKAAPKRMGIASKLYTVFNDALRVCNYQYVYGVIVDLNEASIKMHEKLGFQEVGRFKDVGYKNGQWLGIVWMSKFIGEEGKKIEEPDITKLHYEDFKTEL